MSLRIKFNLVMFITLAIGIALASIASKRILVDNANEELLQKASIMMEMAKSIRKYTVNQVKPVVKQDTSVFIKQTVPAYAATENFNNLREKFPDYSYKEATLNPTNPEHSAADWERDVIEYFKNNPDATEFSGTRSTQTGDYLFLSRPFRLDNPKCLVCHSIPANAPESMLELYGRNNGFGWKLNSVIGAQLVSVPMSVPLARADSAFKIFMLSLTVIFLFIWLLLNILLHFIVIKPIKSMAEQADKISKGHIEVPEFKVTAKDEIALMATSFNRMHRSLGSASKLIKQQRRAAGKS